jgi:4-amino-4-deoxy-L-arabinose transferase-like glycosyltransferase
MTAAWGGGLGSRLRQATRGERGFVIAAVVLGLAIRIVYVLVTRHHVLTGDEPEYDLEGRLIAAGHVFWTTTPYGILHASAWKAPGYPAWIGFWYWLVGHHVLAVRLVQAFIGIPVIVLTWLLARRLFGPRVAILSAFVVAIFPMVWQYEELYFSESLSTPLTLLALLLLLTGPRTRQRALLAGLVIGVSLLIRPSDVLLLAGAVVAWWATVGWRRGTALAALTVLAAVIVVAPWTYRNSRVEHGFLPISLQDAAAYGTFNRDSANNPVRPYEWQLLPPSDANLIDRRHPLGDLALRSKLLKAARSYISAHPASLAEAFYWNGLTRLWDVRRPTRALDDARLENRNLTIARIGLGMYYGLLPLALVGLWRARRRRDLVRPVLAIALAASIVFTSDSGTRYRTTLEPLIVVLACSTLASISIRSRKSGPHMRSATPVRSAEPTSTRASRGE